MLAADQVLLDRYEVGELVAMGSQALVWRGRDRQTGRPVAIKMMRELEDVAREAAERQFRREFELLQGGGPGLPQAHAILEHETHVLSIVDWVEGCRLDFEKVPMEPVRAVALAASVLDIVGHLHAKTPPVLVRDIKPQNLIAQGNQVWLIDLGTARAGTSGKDTIALGTPGYAAPEQYLSRSEKRSDIYAVGALLHHLLTGQDVANLNPPLSPRRRRPELSEALDAIVRKATSPDLDVRYSTAGQMAAELRRLRRTQGAPTARFVVNSRRVYTPPAPVPTRRGTTTPFWMVPLLIFNLVRLCASSYDCPSSPPCTVSPSLTSQPEPRDPEPVPAMSFRPAQHVHALPRADCTTQRNQVPQPHHLSLSAWLPGDWSGSVTGLCTVGDRTCAMRATPPRVAVLMGDQPKFVSLPGQQLQAWLPVPEEHALYLATDESLVKVDVITGQIVRTSGFMDKPLALELGDCDGVRKVLALSANSHVAAWSLDLAELQPLISFNQGPTLPASSGVLVGDDVLLCHDGVWQQSSLRHQDPSIPRPDLQGAAPIPGPADRTVFGHGHEVCFVGHEPAVGTSSEPRAVAEVHNRLWIADAAALHDGDKTIPLTGHFLTMASDSNNVGVLTESMGSLRWTVYGEHPSTVSFAVPDGVVAPVCAAACTDSHVVVLMGTAVLTLEP